MTYPSDRKPRRGDAARAWWSTKTPEERSAWSRAARAAQKGPNVGRFKTGDPHTVEAARKGGKAWGPSKGRSQPDAPETKTKGADNDA